jgi:hypothetical protein
MFCWSAVSCTLGETLRADGISPRRPGSRVGSSVRYGQIAMQAAMSLFALTAVAAANLHAPISFGFAFTSTISSVDEAFGGKPPR